MIQRIILGLTLVAGLISLIVYSQIRVTPPFVSGVLETDEIRLGSRIGGRVQHVWVNEGERVEAGILLIELEPYDLLQREQQAIAELAVRDADLKRLTSGLRTEEIGQAKSRLEQLAAKLRLLEHGPRAEEIDAAQERLNAAQAQQLLTRREYDRRANLAQSDAISSNELDTAKEQFDGATADVQIKKNELAILKAGARIEEIEQAQAQVEEARLAWELAKQGYRSEEIESARAARDATAAALAVIGQQKAELTIVAPSAGIIDALDLQPGDLVAPNAPVLTLLSDNHLWVRAYVPQHFLHVRVGQELDISIDSYPQEKFRGVISFVSHQSEFTPSNVQTVDDRAKQVYRIRVRIVENTQRLRAGMTANVWLPSAQQGSRPANE
jgi:multidrug resistance efflux pump